MPLAGGSQPNYSQDPAFGRPHGHCRRRVNLVVREPRNICQPGELLFPDLRKEITVLSSVLIIVLLLILVGVLPAWRHSSRWGYAPGGTIGAILFIVVVLALIGQI
jgi:hypothetical protein